MPVKLEDLPEEIKKIIGKPAEEGACIDEQEVCFPDHRVTAQLVDVTPAPHVKPWRIKNGNTGYLYLCPGGEGGMIGGLLGQLEPKQIFSHMGIMVKDRYKIRQATAVQKRMEYYPHRAGNITSVPTHYIASIIPGLKDLDAAPTDGFQDHALRYGWPGTLTQTIDEAYRSWFPKPPNEKCPDPDLAFQDGAVEECEGKFYVGELSFAPVQIETENGWESVWPVIVKPCDSLETERVQQALRRIARAAQELNGHYRFYGFTWAGVGLEADKGGPVLVEHEVLDPGCFGYWKRPFDSEKDKTVAMVCSTLVWLAVQKANAKDGPRIILDGRAIDWSARPVVEVPCPNYIERHPFTDQVYLPAGEAFGIQDPYVLDGLYYYDEADRLKAGQWLYEKLYQKVVDELASSTDFQNKVDDEIFGKTGKGMTVRSLYKLFAIYPIGTISTLLGISGPVVRVLARIFSDLPDDIASQTCNAFAHDDCTPAAKDRDDWQNPGEGYTVSPDNILRSWAAPTYEDDEYVFGVYGSNAPAAIAPPRFFPLGPPPSTWQISDGFGFVEGRVTMAGTGIGVEGADVRIGCLRFRSGPGGYFYHPRIPAGVYWAECHYQDPKQDWLVLEHAQLVNDQLHYGKIVEITDGNRLVVIEPVEDDDVLSFTLQPPPESQRRIWFEGHMDLVNRYAIGKDWWDHPRIDGRHLQPAYMGDFFPNLPQFKEIRKPFIETKRCVGFQIDDWGEAEFCFDLSIQQPGNAVQLDYRARLKSAEDDPWTVSGSIPIPPKGRNSDPGVKVTVDLARSELAWPVRAHIELTVHNDHAL